MVNHSYTVVSYPTTNIEPQAVTTQKPLLLDVATYALLYLAQLLDILITQ